MEIKKTENLSRMPITIFHIDGRINLDTADDLRNEAQSAHQNGVTNLILDMKDVKSLTSEGLRAIHFIYKLFLEATEGKDKKETTDPTGSIIKSTHLKILNPPDHIRRVIKIAGFDLFIDVFDDMDQAIASF